MNTNKYLRSILALLCVFAIAISSATTVFAHSGRTDSSGGHRDNKNKSGLGHYHYHCGGYPAHLHPGGHCPYREVFPNYVSASASKNVLRNGEKVDLSASVYPANACETYVNWTSSDTSVVRVVGDTLQAVGFGTSVITATTFNGIMASFVVTVIEVVAQKVTVTLTSAPKDVIYIGDTVSLSAAITPSDTDSTAIAWKTSDSKVATVDSEGLVTTCGEGTVNITATASNGVAGTYSIKVTEKKVESISVSEKKLELFIGSKHQLKALVVPSDASFPEVKWSSGDTSILTISEHGVITPVGCGKTTITATSSNGLTDKVEVTVDEILAESLDIKGDPSVFIGSTIQLDAVISPENTSYPDIEWSSSDETVAFVDEKGTITALQVGKITITAKQKDITKTFELEVLPIPAEDICIQCSSYNEMTEGETARLTAIVYPYDATCRDVTWSVDKPRKATIDENGHLETKSFGTIIVTASTKDGYSETYEIKIRMNDESKALAWFQGVSAVVVVITAIVLFDKYVKKKQKENGNEIDHLS